MAITALTDLTKLPNRSMDQQTFDNAMALLISNLPLRAQQENELAANLNSIAAGGAYAIPYIWNAANNAGAMCTSGAATEQQATGFDINNVAQGGVNVLTILQQLNASGSAVKATMRVQKQNDPSRWLLFNVTARTDISNVGYQHLDGVMIAASHADPFAANDLVMLFFQRTGDKGDIGTYPRMLVRDQGSSGTAPQSLSAGWNTRRLATVVYNDIPNASLSSNLVTLPVGRYLFDASAPASTTNGHVLALRNTSGGYFDVGVDAFAGSNVSGVTSATLIAILTFSSQTQVRLDHYAVLAGNGGTAIGNGVAEVYAQMSITKLA